MLIKKIPYTSALVTTTILNTKSVQNKITDTTSLVTTAVPNIKLIEVESKIPDYANYIITQELNILTAKNVPARLTQANLVGKLILLIN